MLTPIQITCFKVTYSKQNIEIDYYKNRFELDHTWKNKYLSTLS